MIQRIQTLYLLLAAGLIACASFMPLATFACDGTEYTLYALGLRDAEGTVIQSTLYMAILAILALVLPVVTIFLFKRRMLQFRLAIAGIVLQVGFLALIAIYIYLSNRAFSTGEFISSSIRIPVILPLAAVIFTYLAARAIFRDEVLVRSLDRIR